MSFMFHPYPYKDLNAVNPVSFPQNKTVVEGALPVAKKIASLFTAGAKNVAIDGYAGTEFEKIIQVCAGQVRPMNIKIVRTESLLKPAEVIREMLSDSLSEDRTLDPVLLYGVRIERTYEDLFDMDKVNALIEELKGEGKILVVGRGALCQSLRALYCERIWADITPRTAALNYKYGKTCNFGETEAFPFNAMMRRNYYVDFELAVELRWNLIREGALTYYITADEPTNMSMLPYESLCALFEELGSRPFRCRPVYLEGVWGGWYIHRLRKLPKEMRNCAWVFDMIPMEVSLAATWEGHELEVPFFTFVMQQAEHLLGKPCYDTFGGYFPVRFNYDDTFHSSGNMSIQCHPDADWVVKNHGELGRQDESYYVCVAGQNACTYLGFKEEGSCEAFFEAAEKAQETGELIDYKKYVNSVPSIPGTQVMIPAGTIHASGHNQVILEIGSLTVGSYTYKLYDYQRTDPQTGLPRPIHLAAGRKVIHGERTSEWVAENLVNHGGVKRQGEDWKEVTVGEHDLLYFALQTETFTHTIEDDTRDRFHVLALTEGEKVRIESINDPSRSFTANYLDVIVVPADLGAYRIVNLGQGDVTVHKTCLKEGFEACAK